MLGTILDYYNYNYHYNFLYRTTSCIIFITISNNSLSHILTTISPTPSCPTTNPSS
jgi:hypothetical protein